MSENCKFCGFDGIGNRDFITPIIKLVDYCNFACDFCRYHQNPAKNTMDFETYKMIIDKSLKYNIQHGWNHMNVIYHGGEPLLWGFENFQKAVEHQHDLKKIYPDFSFENDVQTNASLLNDEWITFFKEHNFHIGISIDGPDDINFHRNSKINSEVVLNNIHKLHALGCHFGILSVITNQHAGKAKEYYDFLQSNNIHSVGLCFCVDEDNHTTIKNEILIDFLIEFFNLYFFGSYNLRVREFESCMRLYLKKDAKACTYSFGKKCNKYFSILPNGDVMFCDPYSLNEKSLGNIKVNDFYEIKSSTFLQEICKSIEEHLFAECANCSIKDICGGGCYRNIINGKNIFCETFKVLYPYIEKTVKSKCDNTNILQIK